MKTLLIITDLGHASPRIPGIAKHLAGHGWEATIITPAMSEKQKNLFLLAEERNLRFLETAGFAMTYRDLQQTQPWRLLIRRVLKKLRLLQYFAYPDEHRQWMRYAVRSARHTLERSRFDVILSSSSPVTAHLVAAKISAQYGIPWVADLRDLWTQNHNYPYSKTRRFFENRLERRILEKAQVLTTVTPQLQHKLEEVYGKKVFWLPNGYNPTETESSDVLKDKRFTISYTGQIYAGKQDIQGFLNAFQDWVSEGRVRKEEVVFKYFGRSHQIVERLAGKWPSLFRTNVEVHGPVPLNESHDAQRRSDLLLLLNWNDPEEKGIATTKLFEYLGTGIPIVATGGFGGDYVEQVLAATKAGFYCRSREAIIGVLQGRYDAFSAGQRIGAGKPNAAVKEFSYSRIAAKLADLLQTIAGSAKSP